MENGLVMKLNEILLWLSIIVLSAMAYLLDTRYSIILIFWAIIIVSAGNAKRFYSKSHIVISTIIRRSIYVVPFLFPLITDFSLSIKANNLKYWCLLGFVIGILLILPKINEWRIMLSKDMIEFTPKREKVDYYTQIAMLIGAAIAEEIFFRNFVIGYIANVPYIYSVLLSCGLFFLNHFGVKWNDKFEIYDYSIQIIFSIISSIIFIVSGSIIPSIIAHIVYNSPPVLLTIKSCGFHYTNKDRGKNNG